jgi:hypothetical protein
MGLKKEKGATVDEINLPVLDKEPHRHDMPYYKSLFKKVNR